MLAARLSLRNLRRRPLRSALTVAMICTGTALIVFSIALAEGIYGDMLDLATRVHTGHLQLLHEGYLERPHPKRRMADVWKLKAGLGRIPAVKAVSVRAELPGMVTTGRRAAGLVIVGLEPAAEARVSGLAQSVVRGRWVNADARIDSRLPPLVLGSGVAEQLKVDLGDEVHFASQDVEGGAFLKSFVVTGVAETGLEEVDASQAFTDLAVVQALLRLRRDEAHRVVGVLEDRDALAPLAAAEPPRGIRLAPWSALLPDLHRSIETDYVGMRAVLGLILVLVVLGISNIITMGVVERRRELGVLSALGARPGHITGVVLWEGIWMSLLGVAAGTAVGVLLGEVGSRGIPLPGPGVELAGVVIHTTHSRTTLEAAVVAPFIIFVAGALAGVLPSLRAARMAPAQAITRGAVP